MWTIVFKWVALAVVAGSLAGCIGGAAKEAKAQTKRLETRIAAEEWKSAAELMDSTMVWVKHDGTVVEPPVDARIQWLKEVKSVGTAITFSAEDHTTPGTEVVVVKTEVQVRVGDSTKPANTFWTCSIRWKKIKDAWKIVEIRDLSAKETKTGA